MKVSDCRLVDIPKIPDNRGNLSFVEQNKQIPFEICRTYWIYDVPGGEERGGHAYHTNDEFIIALSGSFDVVVNDGEEERVFTLNRSYYGVYLPHGLWRSIRNFSTNSLALEFGSVPYDESDYVFEYGHYLKLKADGKI
ncbi:MAG: WxcM-like domain-containing protein [Bacteroidales bacterium]|nr:WxcM-like domain-containing protein [Bacteroidales bacterium]